MKQNLLKKTLLLLLALVVGTGTSWATDNYQLVTSVNDLAVGDVIIITSAAEAPSEGNVYALGPQASNNRTGAAVTFTSSTITNIGDAKPITLGNKNNDGYYTLLDGSSYLYAANSSKNYLKTTSTTTYWEIKISSNKATITDKTSETTRNIIRYNPNSGSPIFSCYASGQNDVYIFKSMAPTIAAANVTIEDNATSGEISYSIANPVDGKALTAAVKDGEWISNVAVTNNKVTFTTTANTSEEADRTGSITLTYGDNLATKDVTITQKKLVTCTVSITAPSNGTLVVKNGEDEVASGSKVRKSTVLTIVATPNSGYRLDWWKAGSTEGNGNTWTIYTDVTFSAQFTEVSNAHTAAFFFNGEQIGSGALLNQDEAIPFPVVPTNVGGKVFIGWAEAAISTPTDVAPATVTTATMGSDDINYYAVYATRTTTSAGSLTKMTSSDTFSKDDKVVIVAVVDENTSYALYQETVSSSYVQKYTFDGSINTIAKDEKNYLTVTAGNDDNWKLGDSTNGFIYNSSSNNLAVSTDNATEFTLSYGTSGFNLMNGNNYLSYRSDLTNKYFRMGGSGGNGVVNFDIYKYTDPVFSYSAYCTAFAPVALSVSSVGYATLYYSDCNLVVPAGVEAYTYDVTTILKESYVYTEDEVIPAGTAVVIKAAQGNYDFAVTIEDGLEDPDNKLKGSDAAETTTGGDKYYALALKKGSTDPSTIGFYWMADEGAAFTNGAHKAYLAVTDGQSVKSFFLFNEDDTTTGVEGVKTASENDVMFNLAGQRVNKANKGIFIVNGKKVVR